MVAINLHVKAGTYTVLKNICPLLMKNHEVTILTNDSGEIDIECNNLIKLKSSNVLSSIYGYTPKLPNLINIGDLNKYDIIHLFEYTAFPTDCIVFKKNKIKSPLILSLHGTLHQSTRFPFSFLKKIHNYVMLRYVDRINTFIASTEAEKNHVIKKGIPEEKIKILSLGVSIPEIKRTESFEKYILYLGRLSVTKNIDVLIKAFSICTTTDVNLVIAGEDFGVLEDLRKLVKTKNLENRVIFKGKVTEQEKFALLSGAMIFVHPSLEDVFSLALIEAASVGVPSVAFDVEANSEILDDMITGRIVKEKSPASLASVLDSLLNDKDLREMISINSRKIIPDKYNWNNTVDHLNKYYEFIIKNDHFE